MGPSSSNFFWSLAVGDTFFRAFTALSLNVMHQTLCTKCFALNARSLPCIFSRGALSSNFLDRNFRQGRADLDFSCRFWLLPHFPFLQINFKIIIGAPLVKVRISLLAPQRNQGSLRMSQIILLTSDFRVSSRFAHVHRT